LLKDLKHAAILKDQRTDQQHDISPEVEVLKSRLFSPTSKNKYKPFYYGWNNPSITQGMHDTRIQNPDTKYNCCLVDILGRPQKDGQDMPLMPYQKLLYKILHEHKQIWIKKSRGIGVTTFFLYWLAYCCLTKWKPGDRVCVVVGPRIELAQDFRARFKSLFRRNFPNIYSELAKQQSTIALLNGVKVEAFPSHHVDTMRGLDNVKFIMSDESDYYPHFQQKEVRAVCEGYIGKPNSDPAIIICSTPKAPGGLLQQIEL